MSINANEKKTCTRPSVRPAALAVLACLLLPLSSPLQAAESISAYVDPNGRVVFVNEENEPGRANLSQKTKSAATATPATGRRMVASTNPLPGPAARSISGQDATAPQTAAESTAAGAGKLDEVIEQTAKQHQIDPELVRAIIQVESNFDPNAVSPKGALGLMQLIPSTAARFGVSNAFDPRANIDGGVRYLKYLLGTYGGNLQLSLAAYNAGENSVARFGGVPAFRETQEYIRRIGELYPMRTIVVGAQQEPQIVRFVDDTGITHFSNTDLP